MTSVIARPAAYFISKKWLGEFACRVDIGIAVFLSSAIFALSVALMTVSYQAMNAAASNPVEALRYE